MQLYFNPVTYGAGDATRTKIEVDAFSGFYLCFQPTRPTSVGRIDIAGPDFRAPPTIAPNYLSTREGHCWMSSTADGCCRRSRAPRR